MASWRCTMAQPSAELVGCVYPLADALQLGLALHMTEPPRLTSLPGRERLISVTDDLGYRLEMKVQAGGATPDEAWVYLRARGKMFFFVRYHRRTNTLDLFVVNREKVKRVDSKTMNGLPFDTVLKELAGDGAFVACFSKTQYADTWTTVYINRPTIADPLDNGRRAQDRAEAR